MLKDSIENEIHLNPGVPTLDIIIVNHDCKHKEGNDYLNSIDNLKTYCGVVKVLHRKWNKGQGMCMGSYEYAFQKFKLKYDYWFFHEDDYKIVEKGYYKNGIELLNKEKDIAFVGFDMGSIHKSLKDKNSILMYKVMKWIFFIPILWWGYGKYLKDHNKVIKKTIRLIKNNKLHHACGPNGLTHRDYLNAVITRRGNLPYPKLPNPQPNKKEFKTFKGNSLSQNIKTFIFYNQYLTWWWLHVILGEIEFTRVYYDMGYKIEAYPYTKRNLYSYKTNTFKQNIS
tara:strand:+ start:503 stop:1351 length:849 start_codon:yes stop_codon:yes gene_type:complete